MQFVRDSLGVMVDGAESQQRRALGGGHTGQASDIHTLVAALAR